MDGWRHFQNDVRRSKEAPLGMNKCVRRDGFTFAYETNKLNDTYPRNWIKWDSYAWSSYDTEFRCPLEAIYQVLNTSSKWVKVFMQMSNPSVLIG